MDWDDPKYRESILAPRQRRPKIKQPINTSDLKPVMRCTICNGLIYNQAPIDDRCRCGVRLPWTIPKSQKS